MRDHADLRDPGGERYRQYDTDNSRTETLSSDVLIARSFAHLFAHYSDSCGLMRRCGFLDRRCKESRSVPVLSGIRFLLSVCC